MDPLPINLTSVFERCVTIYLQQEKTSFSFFCFLFNLRGILCSLPSIPQPGIFAISLMVFLRGGSLRKNDSLLKKGLNQIKSKLLISKIITSKIALKYFYKIIQHYSTFRHLLMFGQVMVQIFLQSSLGISTKWFSTKWAVIPVFFTSKPQPALW